MIVKVLICVVVILSHFCASESTVSERRLSKVRTFIKPADCDERIIKIGQCVDRMLLVLDSEVTNFDTIEDFEENYCEPFPEWSKCFMQYKTCLKPFQASLLSLINYNVKQVYRKLCKNDKRIQEAYEHLKCLLPDGREMVNRYKDKILTVIDYVTNATGFDQLIERGCCGIAMIVEDFEETFDDFCKGRNGLQSGKFVVSLATACFSDVWNMICAKHPTVQSCSERNPEIAAELRQILTHPYPSQPNTMDYIVKFLAKLDETEMAPGRG